MEEGGRKERIAASKDKDLQALCTLNYRDYLTRRRRWKRAICPTSRRSKEQSTGKARKRL